MSKLSFKTFCIEFYANHVGKTSPEVYAEFEKSGLLKELDDDYDDLHGMGMEALMQMFDEYLGRETATKTSTSTLRSAQTRRLPNSATSAVTRCRMCEHHLIRATVIPEVARLIAERFDISPDEALSRFYHSATAENLADEENGLYGQSARFIYSQFLEEEQTRNHNQEICR